MDFFFFKKKKKKRKKQKTKNLKMDRVIKKHQATFY